MINMMKQIKQYAILLVLAMCVGCEANFDPGKDGGPAVTTFKVDPFPALENIRDIDGRQLFPTRSAIDQTDFFLRVKVFCYDYTGKLAGSATELFEDLESCTLKVNGLSAEDNYDVVILSDFVLEKPDGHGGYEYTEFWETNGASNISSLAISDKGLIGRQYRAVSKCVTFVPGGGEDVYVLEPMGSYVWFHARNLPSYNTDAKIKFSWSEPSSVLLWNYKPQVADIRETNTWYEDVDISSYDVYLGNYFLAVQDYRNFFSVRVYNDSTDYTYKEFEAPDWGNVYYLWGNTVRWVYDYYFQNFQESDTFI